MKIVSIKKAGIGIFAFSVAILALIFAVFSVDNSTNKMIVEYANNMGWQVNPTPIDIRHITIPSTLDSVYTAYNAVQKKSGFDIEPFCKKRVTRYTYKLENHKRSAEMNVFLGVLVYESRIIAADIYSNDMEGFMHGISEISQIKGK